MRCKLITKTIQSLRPTSKPYDARDNDLAGFLLRVLPSGGMAYFCDYRRPDGRRTRIKIGDSSVLTPAQARDEALKILGDRARGTDPAKTRQATKQDTLESFIERHYRPWVEAHRKSGKQTVKRILAIFSEFRDQRLSDISPWKVEKWRSVRLKNGTAASTVNRNITMLKATIEKAVEWEMIESNPLAKVKPLKTDRTAKVRFLSPDEEISLRTQLDHREARIREERRSHNSWCNIRGYATLPVLDENKFADYLKPMVLISINTGIRRGELFSLKWENIDFQRRTLTVIGEEAKSGATRHIPLNDEAYDTLIAWKSQTCEAKELVFVGRNNERFDNIRKSWGAVLKASNIEAFRWHDLRHHFASMLVMNGVDLNTVRELLGHSDLKVTLRYAHLAPQIKAEAVAKLTRPRPDCVIFSNITPIAKSFGETL